MKKIKDITATSGFVEAIVMLSDKVMLSKNNGEPYMQVSIIDATGSINFPIWKDVEKKFEKFEVGKIYHCYGEASSYNDEIQLKNGRLEEYDEDYDVNDFVSRYDISDDMKNKFDSHLESLGDAYKEVVDKAIERVGLENFHTAPAATKHHHNKLGGLFFHTLSMLNLADTIETLYPDHSEEVDLARLKTKIIFHDIKKTEEYTYPIIGYNKENSLPHYISGSMLLQSVNDEIKAITNEQLQNIAYGILSHHGQWGPFEPKTKEDQVLHMIDMIDSRMGQ